MAAAAGQVPVTAIFNPNSGPGLSTDPNYVAAMTHLESAGGRVVAYVPSSFGSAPLAAVEADVLTYITQYGSLINGFFIDQMNILPSTLAYYTAAVRFPPVPKTFGPPATRPLADWIGGPPLAWVYQAIDNFIKTQGASYTVIGNPGTPFLNGVSPQDFLSTADVLNIFEGPNTAPAPGAAGFDAYPYNLNWFLSFPSSRFSNIVFDVPADAGNPGASSAMLADLSKAIGLNAGSVYLTDQNLPNPYGQLPSYWNEEVSALRAIDSPVPEPGILAKLASAALCGLLAVAVRGLGRKRRLGWPTA
jgi:hypothetical protein